MEGLKRGTVAVVPHDSRWQEEARQCMDALKKILGNDAAGMEHVGSTAIPGICAKPIVDIAVAVGDLQDMLKHNEALEEQGFYYRGQDHEGQLLYVCGDLEKDIRTHHIHVVLTESQAWKNYRNFRDYMNSHPEEAKAYAQLKQDLAAKYAEDRKAYTAGKQEFIDDVLRKAEEWRKEK